MATVYIIDDEPEVCEVLRSFLETEGHTVQTATTTEDVIDRVQQDLPDLILLDVVMPEKNGLEILPQLKKVSPGSYVVIITGLDDYRIADLFYEAGVNGFLIKPIRLAELRQAIQRLLNHPATSA